jgi:anti-sigma factor RsiW
MNCHDVEGLLDPYFDQELDLMRSVEVEQHLKSCEQCSARETNLRSLRSALSAPALRYQAPSSLRDRIFTAPPPTPSREKSPTVRQFVTAASILFLMCTSAMIGRMIPFNSDDRLLDNVVAAHIRSLQVEHAMDVASTDQHTVKPWFHGKVDFSPQVPDLAKQEFSLTGGRLDYLVDRPVAAIVYYRRLHAINVFTWPAEASKTNAPHQYTRQGFHIRTWNGSGMIYWVISDLNDAELDEFVKLYSEAAAANQEVPK